MGADHGRAHHHPHAGCEAALAAGMQVVVCPSVVSAHCDFPAEALRVASLVELSVDDLAA